MKKNIFAGIVGLLLAVTICSTASATVINLDSLVNTYSNTVDLELTSGQYTVTPIQDLYTSWNAWGNTSGDHGWINNYSLVSSEFAAYLVSDGIRYKTPEDAFLNAVSTSFTLLTDTTVSFYIGDSYYKDNIGGISLSVAPVPEPATLILLGTGLIGLCTYRRSRKS